ncbi:HDOD domain-containing protein, partial [bacterium]|nr:HDOD domain-containing protein [bacterium]
MKKRILFVDDEPDILSSLRRMLRPARGEWEMAFCDGGVVALEKMAEEPFDVVVSDIRMPEMDGVELLTRVKEKYPQTVRIALSGHSKQDALLRSVGPTHQFLAKPCDADILIGVITRSCALRDLLSDTSLVQFATNLESLPSLPTLYLQVLEELKSPTSSLTKVGEIIAKDIGMTAKILQLVNSAFFGIPRHIASPAQAASLLGVDITCALVLSVKIFSDVNLNTPSQLDLERLWRHSYLTSLLAKEIAQRAELDKKSIDDVFLAGMLHDVGILILASGFP